MFVINASHAYAFVRATPRGSISMVRVDPFLSGSTRFHATIAIVSPSRRLVTNVSGASCRFALRRAYAAAQTLPSLACGFLPSPSVRNRRQMARASDLFFEHIAERPEGHHVHQAVTLPYVVCQSSAHIHRIASR